MRKVEHQIIYITTKIPTMRMNETTVYQPFDIKIGFVLQSNFRSIMSYIKCYYLATIWIKYQSIFVGMILYYFMLRAFQRDRSTKITTFNHFRRIPNRKNAHSALGNIILFCPDEIITLKLLCNNCQNSKIPTKIAFNVQSIIGFVFQFYC